MPVKKSLKETVYIVFNAQVAGNSMGGGDKIVLSLSQKLRKKNFRIQFVGCPDGEMMVKKNIGFVHYTYLNNIRLETFGLLMGYLLRILSTPTILFKALKNKSVLWSASDYLPDTLPAFAFKLFNPSSRWFANM